jgi:PH/SEC7 domain-containing protein
MSISEFELKKGTSTSFSSNPQSKEHELVDTHGWDATLNGIISDFKGELSQLDPVSGSSLVLQDPTTPTRRPTSRLAMPDGFMSSPKSGGSSLTSSPIASTPPTVTLQLVSDEGPSLDAITTSAQNVPPRSSTLTAPAHSHTTPSTPRGSASKPGTSPFRSRNVNSFGGLGTHVNASPRDTSRLRIQHRSTASSSEPSLIHEPESRFGKPTIFIQFIGSNSINSWFT